jgi:hypothetical protein
MGNDLWLYFGIVVFFFVLWVYAGGPTHPISFAGPYITPVTNVGTTQAGYGSGSSAGSYFDTWTGSSKGSHTNVISSAQSANVGNVRIESGSNPQGKTGFDEYLSVRNDSNADVSLSGWQIVDAGDGNVVHLSSGYRDLDSGTVPLVLASGQSATIYTGSRNTADFNNHSYGSWFVFLDSNHDIWNDRNDTLTLLDAKGKVVDQYRY